MHGPHSSLNPTSLSALMPNGGFGQHSAYDTPEGEGQHFPGNQMQYYQEAGFDPDLGIAPLELSSLEEEEEVASDPNEILWHNRHSNRLKPNYEKALKEVRQAAEFSLQAFTTFLEKWTDPIYREFTLSPVEILHTIPESDRNHIISEQGLKNLRRRQCPICRQGIKKIKIVGEQQAKELHFFLKGKTTETGNNIFHLAIERDDLSLFKTLFEQTPSSHSRLFEKNNSGLTPFALLPAKSNIKDYLYKTISWSLLPWNLSAYYLTESHRLYLLKNGHRQSFSVGEKVTVEDKEYLLKAIDPHSQRLLFEDEEGTLCGVASLQVDPTHMLTFSTKEGDEKRMACSFPASIARGHLSDIHLSNPRISRAEHWELIKDVQSRILLKESQRVHFENRATVGYNSPEGIPHAYTLWQRPLPLESETLYNIFVYNTLAFSIKNISSFQQEKEESEKIDTALLMRTPLKRRRREKAPDTPQKRKRSKTSARLENQQSQESSQAFFNTSSN